MRPSHVFEQEKGEVEGTLSIFCVVQQTIFLSKYQFWSAWFSTMLAHLWRDLVSHSSNVAPPLRFWRFKDVQTIRRYEFKVQLRFFWIALSHTGLNRVFWYAEKCSLNPKPWNLACEVSIQPFCRSNWQWRFPILVISVKKSQVAFISNFLLNHSDWIILRIVFLSHSIFIICGLLFKHSTLNSIHLFRMAYLMNNILKCLTNFLNDFFKKFILQAKNAKWTLRKVTLCIFLHAVFNKGLCIYFP